MLRKVILGLAFTALLAGCTFYIPSEITIRHEGLGDDADEDPTEPPAEHTFLQLHAEVLRVSCQGCHNEANPRAGFSVETYASFMKGVEKGDPDNSLVFYRCGVKKDMPPSGPLPGSQIEKIKVWIEKGAIEQ